MNTGQDIKLEKPYQLSIGGIIRLLEKHFSYANMDSADWEAIDKYVELMKTDETVKFQHKTTWNDLVSEGVS